MDVADFLWKTLEIYGKLFLGKSSKSGVEELRLRPFARFARSHKIWEYGDMGILSISNGLYDQQI
jgi:hypothetical protein